VRETLKWSLVSAASLLVIEVALEVCRQKPYTHLYRGVRQSKSPCRYFPVAAAAVTFAHLEGWIPEKLDPFTIAAGAVRKVIPHSPHPA
jgi:hypothetical protein